MCACVRVKMRHIPAWMANDMHVSVLVSSLCSLYIMRNILEV